MVNLHNLNPPAQQKSKDSDLLVTGALAALTAGKKAAMPPLPPGAPSAAPPAPSALGAAPLPPPIAPMPPVASASPVAAPAALGSPMPPPMPPPPATGVPRPMMGMGAAPSTPTPGTPLPQPQQFATGGQVGGQGQGAPSVLSMWDRTNREAPQMMAGVVPWQVIVGMVIDAAKKNGGGMPGYAEGGMTGMGDPSMMGMEQSGEPMPDMQGRADEADPTGQGQGGGADESELLAEMAHAPRPPAAFLAWLRSDPAPDERDDLSRDLRALYGQLGDPGAGGAWLLLTRIADEEPDLVPPALQQMVDQFSGKRAPSQVPAGVSAGAVGMGMPPLPPGR